MLLEENFGINAILSIKTTSASSVQAFYNECAKYRYELSEGMMRTRKLIESAAPGQEIGVFIGPEGGFEEAEVELAMQSGFMPVTLGKRILRTETAGLTVMAWLMYQLEDSGIS